MNHTRKIADTYPYPSGSAFRLLGDHIIDDTRVPFYPKLVKNGDTIFLKTKYMKKFLKYMHPHIKARYVLITHCGDEDIPGEHFSLLEDKKIIAWFGINTTISHPKLFPIPFGLESLPHTILTTEKALIPKTRLLNLCFSTNTYPQERVPVKQLFSTKDFCTIHEKIPFQTYLEEMKQSKFTVSPRGNGIDCVRVWEAVCMGTIPVVKTSSLDSLYEGLPILIVQDWTDVTEAFLEKKYAEITSKELNLEKFYMDYWIAKINACKKNV